MSTLKEIETDILALPSTEFEQLRQWFFDLDYERWDNQIEQDIKEGKLESFAEEAIAVGGEGRSHFVGEGRSFQLSYNNLFRHFFGSWEQ